MNVENAVTARRLAFIPEASRADAAKAFVEGTLTVNAVAEKFGLKAAPAAYGIRQTAVAEGLVKPLRNAEPDTVRAASAGPFGDTAWLAARTGLTGQKIQKILKLPADSPPEA